jgi:site-specific DNA-methyltransferase (adenine-specific)
MQPTDKIGALSFYNADNMAIMKTFKDSFMKYSGFEKEEHFDRISFYNGDCMDLLKQTPDKYYDLALVDPPYGIEIAEWDKERPTDEYWEQLFRVSKNQIVWGGNYFNLPIKRQWICWDKSVIKAGYLGKREFDEFELAWTSFDGKCKMIRFSDIGNMNGFDGKLKVDYTFKGKIHPCQKHINIYDWILQNYAKPNDLILDTHLGSGSIAIAIDKANTLDKKNLTFVGIELDTDYYNAALNRFKNYKQQKTIFDAIQD